MPRLKENSDAFKAKIFKALADPVRLQIVRFLRDGERCVCEIVPQVAIAQPIVSRHLKILKECGILKERKVGNRRLYSITDAEVFKIIDAVTPKLIDVLSRRIIEQIV